MPATVLISYPRKKILSSSTSAKKLKVTDFNAADTIAMT